MANKNLINIFLVYFFLTFAIGYIDFDRRVENFDDSVTALEEVVKGESYLPMARRVLIPYIIYFVHEVSNIPLNYAYALFRFAFFFLSFILFHIYLKKWFDDKLAMIGTLSVIASLPLTLTNWHSIPTDMPELITFILGAMWVRDNRYKHLFLLIFIGTFNRETTLALVLLYFLNGLGRENPGILIQRTTIYFLLWLIPYTFLASVFGTLKLPPFYFLKYNWHGLMQMFIRPNLYNQYYFVLYLCGFYWILTFKDLYKKDPFLKRSLIVVALYFLFAFFKVGSTREVRIFIPFYVFIIPLGLFSLFKGEVPKNDAVNSYTGT